MNLAAIWSLPVLFVCENNGYADATPVEYAVAVQNIADRAAAYDMPGVIVDGQDVTAVYLAAKTAVSHSRSGDGPSLIECKTYRYYGHHQSDDPLRYRTAEEEASAKARDCIKCFGEQVTSAHIFQRQELELIDSRSRQLVEGAVEFAEKSPLPEPGELYRDVYPEANQCLR
jgi:pyruvate dehydrogenase E1 component alpha subunit